MALYNKRGPKASLPNSAKAGEIKLATDTKEVFISTDNNKANDVQLLTTSSLTLPLPVEKGGTGVTTIKEVADELAPLIGSTMQKAVLNFPQVTIPTGSGDFSAGTPTLLEATGGMTVEISGDTITLGGLKSQVISISCCLDHFGTAAAQADYGIAMYAKTSSADKRLFRYLFRGQQAQTAETTCSGEQYTNLPSDGKITFRYAREIVTTSMYMASGNEGYVTIEVLA